MKWINFLHAYQPPTQTREILDIVTTESYNKIISLLNDFPNLKLTMNISGSLLELWKENGYESLIKSFSNFVSAGRIELVGSAMYHPILPLLSETEIRQQIDFNNTIHKMFFGEAYKPKGFYIPEMAYSRAAAKVIKDMGFEWIILDELHSKDPNITPELKYVDTNSNLSVVFRNNLVSKNFPPEFVIENPNFIKTKYLITAHDAELYGHWHKDDKGYYAKAFSNPDIQFLKVSEYLAELGEGNVADIREASWESTHEELTGGIPYGLWNNPQNIIHQKLWTLAYEVLKLIRSHPDDVKIKAAERYFHRGLASCAWWWASERKLGVFSDIKWHPSEIEKGAKELITAARTLTSADPNLIVDIGNIEKIYRDLCDTVWKRHSEKQI